MNRTPFALFGIVLFSASAPGAVVPDALFSEGAVFQQGIPVPVWGTAGEGEKVEVTLDGKKAATVTKDGRWMVKLPPHATGGPFSLTIAGENTVTLNDVMVGEVWVCAGQSNMAFVLQGAQTGAAEISKADYPEIRMFTVRNRQALDPVTGTEGSWVVCSPRTAGQFSAVGYFFARDLHRALKVPVGMIHTSMSGSPGQAWMSLGALEKEPELANYVKIIQAQKAAYPGVKAAFLLAMKEYEEKLSIWNDEVGVPHEEALRAWSRENAKAKKDGLPPIPQPTVPTSKPVKPADPEGGGGTPTVLFNGKVAPLIPYAIRGVLWYQGESNGGKEYRVLFPRLIADWREKWGQGNFPFLFVQIAPYKDQKPEIREAQLLTWQKVPQTAMVVTTDIGNPTDIHPKNKEPVGVRLALAARAVAYGENIEYSGPVFEAVQIEAGRAVVNFKHAGAGLMAREGELRGFTVAGADRKFVPAAAQIVDRVVIVSSPEVAAPVYVRYGWASVPEGNLFNSEGLPAAPFRTDGE